MPGKADRRLATLLGISLILIFIQVMIGGITRLTGSGLSITDWKIVTGTIPPISADSWQTEFSQYKDSPQYKLLNEGMSLHEFKFIYFWEWLHRFWGRWGFVFLLGIFIWAWRKGSLPGIRRKGRFVFLLILYAIQGLLGWYMVKSGLINDPYVSHYRLTAHLLLAIFLFAFILKWIVDLIIPPEQFRISGGQKFAGFWLSLLLILQIVYGAFMSGLRAAVHYPSWPDMNGEFLPKHILLKEPWYANFLENITTIQFVHRGLAYLLFILIMIYWLRHRKAIQGRVWKRSFLFLPIILLIQIGLGITTLLTAGNGVNVALGVSHQLCGLLLLSTFLFIHFQVRRQSF